MPEPGLIRKTVLVTGATAGIGLATALADGGASGYFVKSVQRKSSAASYDEAPQERAWTTSLAKLGLANVHT